MRYSTWEKRRILLEKSNSKKTIVRKQSSIFVAKSKSKPMLNFKLPKVTVSSLVGLIVAMLSLNGNVIGLNDYAVAAIIFGVTSAASWFWPSDSANTSLRPVVTGISVLSFLGAMAGYFLDKPVVDADGTVHYIVPVTVLQAVIASTTIILRSMQAKESN
jgi:ABC-type enterobactin transport system permease subunit